MKQHSGLKNLYMHFFFQFNCCIKKGNTFETTYTSSHSLQFRSLWLFPLSCSLSCPTAVIPPPPSPFHLSFASVPFEVLNNKSEPHSLFSSEKCELKRHGTAQHLHRWMGVERAAFKKCGLRAGTITVSARSRPPHICQLTRPAQHAWMLKLMSMPVSVASAAGTWQLSASS